jgi:mycothiol system anti-sigma-R factor
MEHAMKDCQAVLARLYEYIDHELAGSDRAEVAAHLEMCRPCLSRFEIEELFNELVVREVPRPAARAEFKQNLLARLAEERCATGSAGKSETVALGWRRFAMAAVVMLAVGVGSWVLSDRFGTRGADWPLLTAYHHEMIPTSDANRIETNSYAEARAFIIAQLGDAVAHLLPENAPDGITVSAVDISPLDREQLVHFSFAGEHSELSLFMAPASAFHLGDEPRVAIGARVYRTATLGCCRAVCWEDAGEYICALIGDCDLPRLLAMAENLNTVYEPSPDDRSFLNGPAVTTRVAAIGY